MNVSVELFLGLIIRRDRSMAAAVKRSSEGAEAEN